MIWTLAIFFLLNIGLAFFDAHKIVKGKWIKHGVNGLVYIAMLAVPFFVFNNWWLILSLLFIRLIVFNIFLSLFRGLSWDYMPLMPASIVDKLAKKVFGTNGLVMYSIYTLLFITTLIIIFV